MFHKTRLHGSVRIPEETLSAAISKVRNIVDKLHPLPADVTEHDSNSVANRYLINAIISFLRDELAIPLLNKVQQDNASSRLLYYTEYLNMAMSAELRGQLFPTSPLKYGRKLRYGVNPIMMLNNTEIPNIYHCMNIPTKENYLPNDLSNYFGPFRNQTEEDTAEKSAESATDQAIVEEIEKRKDENIQRDKFSFSSNSENVYEQLKFMSIALQKALNLSTNKDERGRSEYRNYPSQNRSDNRPNSQTNRATYGSSDYQTNPNYVRNNSGNRQNYSYKNDFQY
jgi:molybdopterin converting factor small subunit